jgi:hypothetical protein
MGERPNPSSAWQWLLAAALGAAVAGCGSDSAVATAPTQLKCQVTLAAPPAPIGSDGGTGSITVTTSPECPWEASTAASWLSGLAPTSGQGTGTVEFRAAANPLPAAREGEIVVNESRLRLSQQPAQCRVELRTDSLNVEAGGGTRDIAVSAPGGCSWTAATDAGWIAFTTPVTGSGDGSVGVSVAPNASGARRLGAIVVGEQRVTVTQEPAPPAPAPGCVYVVNSTSQGVLPSDGADVAASVSAASGCAWAASSSVAWVTVVAGASGTGNGAVAFRVAANTGSGRTGTVTVAGQTFTLTQAAATAATPCAYAIGPLEAAIAAPGGSGTIAVSARADCAWTATSNVAWITIASGASGTGNGAVGFSVAANPGSARTGTIVVAGQTFTVTQAATAPTPCVYSIAPANTAIGPLGGTGTVAVTTVTDCAWTAATTADWIAVTSGASGSGNGSVGFAVAPNPGSARTGTIVVAGQTFTVTQAAPAPAPAPCVYSIAPANAAIGPLGGTGTVAVTTGTDCPWTANTGEEWITVTSGASGSGNGSVGFTVAPNLGSARTGIIAVAGQIFTVTQAAVIPCVYTINPTSASVDERQRDLTVAVSTGTGCAWTATSNAPWIAITAGASGTGSGSVTLRVERNTTDDDRTGTVTIAGLTFTVNQAEDD